MKMFYYLVSFLSLLCCMRSLHASDNQLQPMMQNNQIHVNGTFCTNGIFCSTNVSSGGTIIIGTDDIPSPIHCVLVDPLEIVFNEGSIGVIHNECSIENRSTIYYSPTVIEDKVLGGFERSSGDVIQAYDKNNNTFIGKIIITTQLRYTDDGLYPDVVSSYVPIKYIPHDGEEYTFGGKHKFDENASIYSLNGMNEYETLNNVHNYLEHFGIIANNVVLG